MAEPRRLPFTTITPAQKPKKKVSSSPPSQRFSLTLTVSTETTCPEFSYTELVKNAVCKKERESADPDNPFGDDEEDGKLEAIAKAFEAKYGPKVKTKKGRPSDLVRDLVDLGEGYDETDDFIDNTEAYDEMVPRCLTTKLGGFYINSGMLDFRYASEDSADDFQKSSPIKKKRKIRTIESDSDSNTEVKKRGPKKRKLKEGVDLEKKRKKKLMIGPDGEKIVVKRGRKPLDKNKLKKKTSPTVSELLKQQTASTSTPTHSMNGAGDGNGMNTNSEEGYNPYDQATIGSTIEMLLREDSESREGDEEKKPETITPLPAGLPERLLQTVNGLKKAAKQSREGKCKFFSGPVNKMLLEVEIQSRQVSCGSRQAIYTHLSCFLPCGKETLLKRAKKLRLSQQDDLLRDPINKLKEAVNQMMPTLLEKYDAESQLAALMRMENKEKADSEKETKEEGSTESDDEDQKDGEKKKRIMGPRKKFEWTDHVRNLLCDVVRVKMKTFAAAKQRGQTAEEYVRCFLDMEIRPIWPQGWMQTRMLYKESRSVHAMWTNPQKQRKFGKEGPVKTGSPTPTSVPFGARSNNNSIIEIFDSVDNDTMKEGSGSDKEIGSLRLEDYMDVTDVDKMLTEITKVDDTAMPTILDYADKMNTSGTGLTPDVKRLQGTSDSAQSRSHSSNQASASSQKSRDNIKHGLVSEMLQSPIPSSNSAKLPAPNVLSPTSEQAPQKSAYMAEFEKHLMATTMKESPPKHQSSPTDQSASSKLQSMLAQAQQANTSQQGKQLATPKTALSAQHDVQKKTTSAPSHRLSLVQNSSNILQSSQTLASPTGPKLHGSPSQTHNSPHNTSSQPHKLSLSQGQKLSSTQPTKASPGQTGSQQKKQYMSESRQKESSVPKDLVVPSSLSSSSIDQDAVKQLHHQLMQLATASSNYGGGSSQYKSSSTVAKSVSSTKPAAAQESMVGQLFKQPLPANMAAQQRQVQPAKTSLLKIDTQNSVGTVSQRHSPQDQLRMSPQSHRPVGQGQKQTSSVHMSGGSLHSPTSSRKSPVEVAAKNQSPIGNQLSPSHPRSLLGRQTQNDSLVQAKRLASAKDALSRQKEVEKSILEKVIEEYQTEMKAQSHQQQYPGSGQHKASPPAHSPSQGSMPRTTWQQTTGSSSPSTGASSRLSAFSPPSGNQKPAKPVPHMAVTGYQTVKMSNMSKESPSSTFPLMLPGMQQRSRPQDLVAGSHMSSSPQPAHGVMSTNAGINTFSCHSQPPAAHSTLSPNQHQVTGIPSPHSSPHVYLHSTTPTTTVSALYGRTLPGPPQSPNRY